MTIKNLNKLSANKDFYPPIQRPDEDKYYLSPDEYNIILSTLKQLIDDYNQRIDDIDGEGIKSVITSYDTITPPSDVNLYTALKTRNEILAVANEFSNKYLSKLNDDNATGIITFLNGLKLGTSGSGGEINGLGRGKLRSLELSEWLEVPELRYNRVEIQLGDKWRAPGGGIIELVDPANKIATLKLEDGEYGAISVGDLCLGIIHSLNDSENATSDFDDSKGVRNIRGFASSYFKIEEILDSQNKTFRYSLRPISGNYTKQVSPKQFMHFVAFGNTINTSRQSSVYETRTYQRFLINVNNWEYNVSNIASQFGDLSNLSVHGLNMTDYSIYLNNVYFSGTIQQVKAPIIIDGYWHTWNGSEWVNTGTSATMPGTSPISIHLTNSNISVYDDDIPDLSNTETEVHIYEGEIELTYNPLSALESGQYIVSAVGTNVTPGQIILDNIHANVNPASNLAGNSAQILFNVTGKRLTGVDFTIAINQNITLVERGVDGDSSEFIFKQTVGSDAPDPDPSILDAVQEDDFVPSHLNGNPEFTGWTDNSKGIDINKQYEWRAQRTKKDGIWSKFGSAKLVGKWGKDGLDGDAFEYIFKRTTTLDSPEPSPNTIDPVQRRDFVPGPSEGYTTFIGWTDDFVGPTKNLPYSWICKRERIDGNWGRFTNPEVWSTYSVDGNSIETVYQNTNSIDPPPIESGTMQIDNYIPTGWTKYPESISVNSRFQWESKREKIEEVWSEFSTPALHGVFGEDGDSIEFIYNTTSENVAPSIIYDVPDLNGNIVQDREYLPTDGGTGLGWKDDPIDITRKRPYLWVTTRRKVNGIWEDFRTPKKLSVHGKDGADIEYVFYLTISEDVPVLNQNTLSPSFQEPEYLPKDENNINWLDERPSVSEIYSYRWISSRKRINGVWQPFSDPVLDGSYGKTGAAGAMVEYRGIFDPTKTYEGYPSKIVAVKHGGRYYKTKTNVGTFVGAESVPAQPLPEDSYWENFGQSLESIATGLLLAENANIANFWFSNQRMESRPTDLTGTNTGASLAMYLDGKKGEAMFSYNKVLFKPNGSGYLAGGNITWDSIGNLQLNGVSTGTRSFVNMNKGILEVGESWFNNPWIGLQASTHSYDYISNPGDPALIRVALKLLLDLPTENQYGQLERNQAYVDSNGFVKIKPQ